jgi:hypothetical protein
MFIFSFQRQLLVTALVKWASDTVPVSLSRFLEPHELLRTVLYYRSNTGQICHLVL